MTLPVPGSLPMLRIVHPTISLRNLTPPRVIACCSMCPREFVGRDQDEAIDALTIHLQLKHGQQEHLEMTTSEQINEIAAALAKAQASMKNAALSKVNPHFKNRYADLPAIRDAVTPALAANGIAVVQTLDAASEGAGYCVLTRLLHTSGQWVESLCPIPAVLDMQKMGSAITYARRYSLSAICGIAADEDDDGNAATTNGNGKAQTAAPKAPDGFDDWLLDLEATADEGTVALQAAWKQSQPYFRKHLTDTNETKWTSIKAKAAKVNIATGIPQEMAHA